MYAVKNNDDKNNYKDVFHALIPMTVLTRSLCSILFHLSMQMVSQR